MSTTTAPSRVSTSSVVTIDLRYSPADQYETPAWRARHDLRRVLEDVASGDIVQLRVNRWSLPTDVVGLIPAHVRVQVSATDIETAREWQRLLEARS